MCINARLCCVRQLGSSLWVTGAWPGDPCRSSRGPRADGRLTRRLPQDRRLLPRGHHLPSQGFISPLGGVYWKVTYISQTNSWTLSPETNLRWPRRTSKQRQKGGCPLNVCVNVRVEGKGEGRTGWGGEDFIDLIVCSCVHMCSYFVGICYWWTDSKNQPFCWFALLWCGKRKRKDSQFPVDVLCNCRCVWVSGWISFFCSNYQVLFFLATYQGAT